MTSSAPRIAVTPRRVLALAVPMTLSHVTTPLLGVVGAAAIGRLGDAAALGAIALGAIVFDVLFWSFGSLRMATAGLTAQAIGRGEPADADRVASRALAMAVVIGLVMVVLQRPIGAAAFALTGASPAVTDALAAYFAVRILAAPFTLANYALLGSTLGRGRSDLGLLLQVAINLANIAFTVLFVLGLGWGVAGAGWATLLAETGGSGLGLVVLRRLGSRPWRVPRADLMDRAALWRMLAVNRDVMIRTLALMLSFALFASLGARHGDVMLAANAVLQNMLLVGSYILDGFATAAEILCGQCLGARDEVGFRRAVRLVLAFSFGFGALVAVGLLLGGHAFVAALTTNPEVRDLADRFVGYAAVFPLVGAAAYAFDGIFVGATWTAAMRNLMLAATAVYLAVLWLARDVGNHGLWIALLTFLAMRAVGQAALYPGLARRSFTPSA